MARAAKIDFNPAYLPFNWRGWWAFGTGAFGDMACHIMDPVYRILPIDYPDSVECSVATIWKEMWNDTQNPELSGFIYHSSDLSKKR